MNSAIILIVIISVFSSLAAVWALFSSYTQRKKENMKNTKECNVDEEKIKVIAKDDKDLDLMQRLINSLDEINKKLENLQNDVTIIKDLK